MTNIDEKNIEDYYRIVFDDSDKSKWFVELLKPCEPFHEILYSYGEFSISNLESLKSEDEDVIPKFKYEIDILYVPDRLKGVELPDEKEIEMENLIGCILLDIIGKNADKATNRDGKIYLELSRE